MNSQITDRARLGKWAVRGASGCSWRSPAPASATAGRRSAASRPARAGQPIPAPAPRRTARRDGYAGPGVSIRCGILDISIRHLAGGSGAASLDVDELVEAHQDLAEIGQGADPSVGIALLPVGRVLPREEG